MKEANCWKSQFETCCYSNKLLDKLLLNDKTDTIDILKVKKAIYYAKEYHGKQKRDSGEPFYSHPIEVACIFTNYTSRENI